MHWMLLWLLIFQRKMVAARETKIKLPWRSHKSPFGFFCLLRFERKWKIISRCFLSLLCTSLKSRMLLSIHASEMKNIGLCDVPGHLDEHDIKSKMIWKYDKIPFRMMSAPFLEIDAFRLYSICCSARSVAAVAGAAAKAESVTRSERKKKTKSLWHFHYFGFATSLQWIATLWVWT